MARAHVESLLGFGPSRLIATRPVWKSCDLDGADRLENRRLVRTNVPRQPGVYGFFDSDERLIYVGKAKDLRQRLLTYFGPPNDEQKATRLVAQARRLVWELAPHEFTALVRELELIRRWQPRYNVEGQPGRTRRGYVCLGRGPAPYVYLTAEPSRRTVAAFGPVSLGARTREAVRWLNDQFGLRDCGDHVPLLFADQLELFPQLREPECLRHELGTCLGPCAARATSAEYAQQVRRARDFLNGRNTGLIEQLAEQMEAHAAEQSFERAAVLRDMRDDLAWLDDQLGRLRHARRHFSFVYPVENAAGQAIWHWMARGQLLAVTPAPGDRRTTQRCRRLAQRIYAASPAADNRSPEDVSLVHLAARWFRRHPEELERAYRAPQVLRQLA